MPAADARPAPAPAAADSVPVSRPAGLWLLTIALLVGPIVHLVALGLDRQWLNFGSRRAWDGFVYLLIAPLRRHAHASPSRTRALLRLRLPLLRNPARPAYPIPSARTARARVDSLPPAPRGAALPPLGGPTSRPRADSAPAKRPRGLTRSLRRRGVSVGREPDHAGGSAWFPRRPSRQGPRGWGRRSPRRIGNGRADSRCAAIDPRGIATIGRAGG